MINVCIVTYNRPDFTRQCIEVFLNSPYEKCWRLVVVDNSDSSRDGQETRGWLRHNAHRGIDALILNADNVGFAKGQNQAIAASIGEYCLMCDGDAVLSENWLDLFQPFECGIENIGIVAPMCHHAKPPYRYVQEDYPEHGFSLGYRGNVAIAHAMRLEDVRKYGGYIDNGGLGGWGTETELCDKFRADGKRVALHLGVSIEHLPNTIGNTPEYQEHRNRQKAISEAANAR